MIIFHALSSIFVYREGIKKEFTRKKELTPMMIHDRKIFNCKVSLSIVKSLVIVAKEI